MTASYAPMLWAKGAEIEALASLSDEQRHRIAPVISFLPPEPPREDPSRPVKNRRWTAQRSLAERIDHPSRGLMGCWGYELPLRTDLSLLDHTECWTHRRDPVDFAFALLGQSGVRAVPTIGRHQSGTYRSTAARYAREFGNGACVRLTGEDLSAGRDGLGPVLTELELAPEEIDLVLDYSTMFATAQVYAQVVREQLHRLEPLGSFRSVALASGGFPADLQLAHEKDGRYQRIDLAFWRRCSRLGSVQVDYGDYGVIVADPPPPYAGAANLRYTLPDEWHVWRGEKPESGPGTDYHILAQSLMGEPFWRGSDHCPGCEFIADHASGGGNSTQWRRASFQHHFAVVVEQLLP
jgi:hypothetical protein